MDSEAWDDTSGGGGQETGQERVRLTWDLTEHRGKDDECAETSHSVVRLSVTQRTQIPPNAADFSSLQLGLKVGGRSHVRMSHLLCHRKRISKRKEKMIGKSLIFCYR